MEQKILEIINCHPRGIGFFQIRRLVYPGEVGISPGQRAAITRTLRKLVNNNQINRGTDLQFHTIYTPINE